MGCQDCSGFYLLIGQLKDPQIDNFRGTKTSYAYSYILYIYI